VKPQHDFAELDDCTQLSLMVVEQSDPKYPEGQTQTPVGLQIPFPHPFLHPRTAQSVMFRQGTGIFTFYTKRAIQLQLSTKIEIVTLYF